MSEERIILENSKVSLLDVMGNDEEIVAAARISYNSSKSREHTSLDNEKLIRYLMRHRHTSVFEMAEVKFYLKVPIFVARQLVRHRTANLNEVSGRYSELPNECYVPDVDQCGSQSTENNQGRADINHDVMSEFRAKMARQTIQDAIQHTRAAYDSLLQSSNVSREIARIVLPTAQLTEIVWKCDLHNFLHFCKLRMDSHAQYEIRVMAEAMYELVKPLFPITCQAFEDYILNGKTLSTLDQRLLTYMMNPLHLPSYQYAQTLGMSQREYREFIDWCNQLQSLSGE